MAFVSSMKTHVVLIHGGQTYDTYKEYFSALKSKVFDPEKTQERFWRDVLAERLGARFKLITPSMPNSQNAKYKEWKVWFEKYIPYLSDNTIFIGHSLGGIFLAKYFAENESQKNILGMFLIAAPHDTHGLKKSLADFVLPESLALLDTQARKIHLFHSKNDPIVRYEDVLKYKKELPHAKLVTFKDRQHFGTPEFPELTEAIKKLVEPQN